jgi:hypothetical protein
MHCVSCASGHQAEFTSEINIHFSGLKHIDEPGVLLFPKLLVCLDCGFSQFVTEKTELDRLARSMPATTSTQNGTLSQSQSVGGKCA